MTSIDHIEVNGRRLAYRLRPGNVPTLVFLCGYASDMEGTKAAALDAFAERRGLAMLRFDYSGTGSSGGSFADGTLALWLGDALAALDELTNGPVVLVGSSMGGWIALHLALLRPERVKALIGVAAAADFTDWGFPEEARAVLQRDGRIEGPQLITFDFWQSGQQLRLLDAEIAIDVPVRLLHGEVDREVPLDIGFRLMRRLRSADVQLNVLKGGGHRLSEPHEIAALLSAVEALLEPKA